MFLGYSCTYFITDKDYHNSELGWSVAHVRLHIMSQLFPCDKLRTGSKCAYQEGQGWSGDGWLLIFVGVGGGGVMQKRESPDFTFPEVGIFANTSCTQCMC